MNIKSLCAVTLLFAGASLAEASSATTPILTLNPIVVRPSAEQVAQVEHERNSPIPTLPVLEVRPTIEQISEYVVEVAVAAVQTDASVSLNVPNLQLPMEELKTMLAESVRNALQR